MTEIEEKINYLLLLKKELVRDKEILEKEIDKLNKAYEIINQIRDLFYKYISYVQNIFKDNIEKVVTDCLRWVFEQDLYFHIYYMVRRNQVEVEFIILKSEEEERMYKELIESGNGDIEKFILPLQDSFGGAIVQVTSLILRLIFSELLNIKGIIFLDEPTSMVHPEYSVKLGKFLKLLSEKYNRNFIIVTHSYELASSCDKIYKVEKIDNVSRVENIS